MWIMGEGKISKMLQTSRRNGEPIRTVELTLALEMISSMSLLAVVTFSPAHLSRLMLPRQNFWKLSPSPPPPPSVLSEAAVSWPLLPFRVSHSTSLSRTETLLVGLHAACYWSMECDGLGRTCVAV